MGRTSNAGRLTKARFALEPLGERPTRGLPPINTAAFTEKRTIFPSRVVEPTHPLLKEGRHAAKIGGEVLKGRWKGMPIYTLTLEERATCPTSCQHWRSCYGNNMHWSGRIRHGEKFQAMLIKEVCDLCERHPEGFVVRLHVLGDFYSTEYVKLWRTMIEDLPQLHVFGYTARWNDPIGLALRWLVVDHWDRFAVRFSNAPFHWRKDSDDPRFNPPATISLEHPIQKSPDTFICPEQTGRTESCSTCGACWSTRKRVAFLQH